MQSPDCHSSELASNPDFPTFFFLLNNISAAAIFNIAEMYNQLLCALIFFLKVIIGHKCVARLTTSFPLSARRVVVVIGRSLFHQWMGSDFLSSFPLSAGRVVVVRGRRFSISGWGAISLSHFLKKKKSETKMTASVLKQEILPPKLAGFV